MPTSAEETGQQQSCCPSHQMSNEDHRSSYSMQRREHYQQWLETQVYMDTMREHDIWTTGWSDIPSRDKRTEYPGMGSVTAHGKRSQEHQNATPEPSTQCRGRDEAKKEPSRKSSYQRRSPSDSRSGGDQRSPPPRSHRSSRALGGSDGDNSLDDKCPPTRGNHAGKARCGSLSPSSPSSSDDWNSRSHCSHQSHKRNSHGCDNRSSCPRGPVGQRYDSQGPPYGDASFLRHSQPIENALELDYEHNIMFRYRQMI